MPPGINQIRREKKYFEKLIQDITFHRTLSTYYSHLLSSDMNKWKNIALRASIVITVIIVMLTG
jgi:hypothetical protein